MNGILNINKNDKIRNYLFAALLAVLWSGPLAASPFLDNGDGSVTDKATGLLWQKCSPGQTNDSACSGSASQVSWMDALSYCNSLSLAGKGWRLPNVNELTGLTNRHVAPAPASIDMSSFPSTPAFYYWTSSSDADFANQAWSVDFAYGRVMKASKSDILEVRCVSSAL